MQSRFWKAVVFSGLFLLLVLFLSVSSQLELPAPDGPYVVGRTYFRWLDSSRPEVLSKDPNDHREVVVLAWYPAEAGTGIDAKYFPNLSSLSDELVQSDEVMWWQAFGLHFIRSKSAMDASPVRPEQPFPVVILSPGNGTNIEFYSSLAGEIASHGYIVLGIAHPYDIAAVQLSSGAIAPYDKDQWTLSAEEHQAYSAERIKVRVADVLYLLDQLDDVNASGPFVGIMNLDAVAVAGHSLGGITASEACKADARFKACLNFDGLQKGGPFSTEESAVPPHQPFLFLTKESQLHPKLLERFESMAESYWVVIHGASHQSFTDAPLLQSTLLPGPHRADRLIDLIQEYSLAFLDHTLKKKANNLLKTFPDGEDVTVKVFPSD